MRVMKFIFHGAARHVGRSCVELQTQGKRYLLDCGIKFKEDGFDYPENVFKMKELDAAFISHAHLDHTGALPFFEHHNMICPIFMTAQTKVLTRILLKDSWKIARIKELHSAYDKTDLKKVRKSIRRVEMQKRNSFENIHYTYFNAGHIPGSAQILLEAEGKKILYTGDFNTRPSNLMQGAEQEAGKVDVLISESTYGARDLPAREPLGDAFLDRIEATLKQGGRVLIPAFAVGRSQDVLITLAKRKWPVPIYFDGMCKQVTRKILTTPSRYVQNKDALHKMFFDTVQSVSSEKMRNEIATRPGIFVCTSGMLQGGPAIHYLKHMWHDEKSAVLLTGYQVKNTNGWLLSEQKEVYLQGTKTKVRCYVERFDFSAHLSREDLHEFIKKSNPKHLVFMHGNEEAVTELGEWARQNTNAKVYIPQMNEEIVIE